MIKRFEMDNLMGRFGLTELTIRKFIKGEGIIRSGYGYYVLAHSPKGNYVSINKSCNLISYSKEGIVNKRVTGQIRTIKINSKLYLYDISTLRKRSKSPKDTHFLRVSEVSYLTGIKEESIRHCSRSGKLLHVFDKNHHRRFNLDAVETFFNLKSWFFFF